MTGTVNIHNGCLDMFIRPTNEEDKLAIAQYVEARDSDIPFCFKVEVVVTRGKGSSHLKVVGKAKRTK